MMNGCPAGWNKDPFSTVNIRCPVPTWVLEAVCSAGPVLCALCSLCSFAIVAVVRRSGGAWSSTCVLGYSALALGGATMSATTALLCDGLSDPGAAWRALFWTTYVLWYGIAFSSIFWAVLIEPAVQFGGGLDAARFKALTLAARSGQAVWLLCIWGCCAPGAGLALFSTSGAAQDFGTGLCLWGCAGGAGSYACSMTYMHVNLAVLARELGTSSSTGRQVAKVRRTMLILSPVAGVATLTWLAMLVVPALRHVTGTLTIVLFVSIQVIIAPLMLYFERSRLGPTRAVLAPSSGNKVHPGQSKRLSRRTITAGRTIASFAANAHLELAQDEQRRVILLGQERQPGGVPRNGVSLQLLRDFAGEFGIDDQITAAEVCTRHVKPTTQDTRAALVTVLQGGRDGRRVLWCDTPTHFVSYTWSYPFRLLIDILECFEEEHPPPAGRTNHYFLDQFSLNQHTFVAEDANQEEMQERLVTALKSQMIKAQHVLMCLHPWSQPIPLSRAWCLFELFVALESKCKTSMCFGRQDADALFAAAKDPHFTAGDAVGKIDAANAEATDASDKELIIGLIKNTMGIERFNATMQAALLKSFTAAVTGVLARAYRMPQRSVRRTPHATPRKL